MLDKVMLGLWIGSGISTAVDVHTTHTTLQSCDVCRETNPFVKPIISSKPASYALTGAFSAGSAWGSWELRKRKTKAWWVPLAINIGVHTFASIHTARMR